MNETNDLYRSLGADEIEALGPMPPEEEVSPTTNRDGRTPGLTAEVHFPGTVHQSSGAADDEDRFPPPRSLSSED
jgi:hypothetical protein